MGNVSKHRRAIAALAILMACCPYALALNPSLDVNQYAHTAWKARDGYFNGAIWAAAQTPDGYLWLGTESGLIRFDGANRVSWQPPDNQQLPSSNIMSLLTTRDGTLWIGTMNGLASWNGNRFVQYAEFAGRQIFALLEDHEGTVWVTGNAVTMGKLCAIRNGNVQCYGDDGTLGRGVFNLFEDSKGNLWAGVKTGIWRWKPGPPKFYPLAGESDGIQALGEDTDGTLLVGWNGGLHRFMDGKTAQYSVPGFPQQLAARRIFRDRDGGVWIATANRGLVHVHEGKADIFSQSDGLSGDAVYGIFEDREGNIWIPTVNGLDQFHDIAVTNLTRSQGLSGAFVFSVLADKDGSVWLSTVGGLDRWNHGLIRNYHLGGTERSPGLNDLPQSVFQDDHGRVWVSTHNAIGYVENDRFTPLRDVPGGAVLSMAQDGAGDLWFASEHLGLFQVRLGNGARKIPWMDLGHKDFASVLAADPFRGGLWLGFFLGGIAYFADGQIRESYTSANGLGEGRISGFQFDHDGALWISTSGGLSRLKNGRLVTLTRKNGLPCDGVNGIMEDAAHSLWLYMPCGLVRIDRAELDTWASSIEKANLAIRFTLFDSFDGVRSRDSSGHFNPQVSKSPDGKLWFVPWDGISVIDPRHISLNKLPPPVHVEKITADGKAYDVASQLRLPPLARDLQIDYTALSLVIPEKVLFRYKLEGHDKDWQQAGTRRQAFYNDLSPGNYRFRVAACNNSGLWNEEGAIFDFAIAPAWYQTAWFQALCGAMAIALIWSTFQLRQRQLQQQFSMRLEARVNERTRIARELHDTLLQSFHGLMFRFQAARNMLPRRPEEAMQALDGAITRAEEAIAESRSAIQDLRSAVPAPADLAQSLTAIGEEIAARNSDHGSPVYRVIVEGERRKLSPAFKDEVCRIARELLQNAFQHARAREIEAEVRYERRMLHLLIRDDGKGIDAKVLEQGGRPGHWGLAGVRERAQQIGAQLDFWSEAGAGTEVELNIPANIAYEKSPESSRFRLFRSVKSHEQS